MTNFLDNGAVLPFGLLGSSEDSNLAGFNKTYRNTSLRMGIVIKSYSASDDNNLTKLTTEYDVLVFEQNEDMGSSIITYKNCISAEGLGSITDFFEKNLRVRSGGNLVGQLIDTKNQDGAVVLIHCLDGISEKAIVVGAINHPDRKTTLKNGDPYLEGEYNGVNIKVNTDGSTILTFKGATNNDGSAKDSSQGTTTIKIEKDGSFQADHDSITFRLARGGEASLTAKKDINLKTNANINITSTGDANVTCAKANVTSSGKTVVTASEINLNGSGGRILTTETDKFIDTIFGQPTVGVPTVKSG